MGIGISAYSENRKTLLNLSGQRVSGSEETLDMMWKYTLDEKPEHTFIHT